MHTVSAYSPLHKVALPRLVGENGIIDTIGIDLSAEENLQLEKSAGLLREFTAKL